MVARVYSSKNIKITTWAGFFKTKLKGFFLVVIAYKLKSLISILLAWWAKLTYEKIKSKK